MKISSPLTNRSATSKASAPRILVAGLVLAGFAAQNASAGFVWDLRATLKNGAPLVLDTAKAVTALPGDVIQIDMFVVITGTGPGQEGFQSGLGKTIATHSGGFGGNQSAPAYSTNEIPPGNPLPTQQDLNGDGFLDLGIPTATAVNSVAGLWDPRFTGSPAFELGTPITNGIEVDVFHFNYTVALNALTGSASVQFTQQLTGIINSASFEVDGVAVTSKNIGLPATANATTLGAPVVISAAVPEPSAFAMLALGALGLVGFRRMGLRRTA